MPDDLEIYVQRDYLRDREPISEIESLTDKAFEVFAATVKNSTWPYELENERAANYGDPLAFTFSTTAMIAFALSLATGGITSSSLVPISTRRRPADSKKAKARKDTYDSIVSGATARIREQSEGLPEERLTKDFKTRLRRLPDPRWEPLVYSATFGWDDPFTLNWLIELLQSDDRAEQQAFLDALCDRALELVRWALGEPRETAATDPAAASSDTDAKEKERPPARFIHVLQIDPKEDVPHSFPLLRVIQLHETLRRIRSKQDLAEGGGLPDLGDVREYLLDRVHRQLSESEIPDGNFDAGELVFALEGWILSSPVEPDARIVERAFNTLRATQERTSYWHPRSPFKATPQGLILLPQSVEIANSILRICGNEHLRQHRYFSQNVDLLEIYRRWLIGRIYHGTFIDQDGTKQPFVGWESEFSSRLDRVHLWQTSQALIFLQHFSVMLEEHLAWKLLDLARFVPSNVQSRGQLATSLKDREDAWEKTKAAQPFGSTNDGKAAGSDAENNTVEDGGGAGANDSVYRIYDALDRDFVAPREGPRKSDTASYSMLLYGPPGTGKSTIARNLAARLGYRFLTVTPSDFITSGGEAVEARAKAIFTALEQQTELVVLFDEIDQLLLDRNSTLYRDQGDIFKLMTPGMLTKLNDLNDRKSVVFAIATNYFERIDPAIKRAGRIDEHYLVLPPDLNARTLFLSASDLFGEGGPSLAAPDAIAKITPRFTYSELANIALGVHRKNPAAVEDDLQALLLAAAHDARPMASADSYHSRLSRGKVKPTAGAEEEPWEEYALLAYLDTEVQLLEESVKTMLRSVDIGKKVKDPEVVAALKAAIKPASRSPKKKDPDGH